jgi:hypothetical protein
VDDFVILLVLRFGTCRLQLEQKRAKAAEVAGQTAPTETESVQASEGGQSPDGKALIVH